MSKQCLLLVLLFLCLKGAAMPAESGTFGREEKQAFKRNVRQYLYIDDNKKAARILQELLGFEARSPSEVKAMIRDLGGWKEQAAGFYKKTFTVKGLGMEATYFISVPADYTPAKPWPLMLCLHGNVKGQMASGRFGIGRGDDGLYHLLAHRTVGFKGMDRLKAIREFNKIAPVAPDRMDSVCRPFVESFIVVAPSVLEYDPPLGETWWRPAEGGWTMDVNRTMVLNLLRNLERDFNIDQDRVFVEGSSMGGAGAWFYGCNFPHRFAGIIVKENFLAGSLPYMIKNAHKLPVYMLVGGKDGFLRLNPLKLRICKAALNEFVQDSTLKVYPNRRHEPMPEDIPNMARWLKSRKRSTLPKRIFMNVQFPDMTRRYWVEVSGAGEGTELSARLSSENRIDVMTSGWLQSYTLFFSDAMIDFSLPISIYTNGKLSFQGKVERSLKFCLEEARRTGDRSSLYWNRLKIDYVKSPVALPASGNGFGHVALVSSDFHMELMRDDGKEFAVDSNEEMKAKLPTGRYALKRIRLVKSDDYGREWRAESEIPKAMAATMPIIIRKDKVTIIPYGEPFTADVIPMLLADGTVDLRLAGIKGCGGEKYPLFAIRKRGQQLNPFPGSLEIRDLNGNTVLKGRFSYG